uniref:Synaptic plasticity regulator PANTS n=1 Tax=Felis catus TaxID=9685 RepID=A0ABI7ZZU7_FELCA
MADGGAWRPPRPCETYSAEWKLCRSARHFLHHYYVHGERPACEQWRRDLANCREWEERRSAEAQPFKSTTKECFCQLRCLRGLVGWVSDFSSGHDLVVRQFKPCIRLSPVSTELLGSSVCPPPPPPP